MGCPRRVGARVRAPFWMRSGRRLPLAITSLASLRSLPPAATTATAGDGGTPRPHAAPRSLQPHAPPTMAIITSSMGREHPDGGGRRGLDTRRGVVVRGKRGLHSTEEEQGRGDHRHCPRHRHCHHHRGSRRHVRAVDGGGRCQRHRATRPCVSGSTSIKGTRRLDTVSKANG